MYDLGDTVALSVTVRNASGTAENATSVTLTVTLPDGTSSTPVVTNDSAGVYSASYATTQAGRHVVRWVATGTNASAFSDVFDVRPAASTALFSLADAKRILNITNTDYDEDLRDFIDATTVLTEQHVGAVIQRTVTEQVWAKDSIALTVTPVVSITSVTSLLVGAWPISTSDLTFDPLTGIVRDTRRVAFTRDLYEVEYVAGRSDGTVPANIRLGARIILKHLWRTMRGPTGRPSGNGGDPLEAVMGGGYAIPNAAAQLFGPSLNMDGIA